MNKETGEINQREDAEELSKIILDSLPNDRGVFNPFRGRILKRCDGNILFKGNVMEFGEAQGFLADHIWKNRKKINKQLKKWKIGGTRVLDCGC